MFNNYYTDPCQENRHRIVEMVSFKSIYQQLRVKFPSVPHQDVACSLNNLFLLICEKEKELIKWYLPNGKFKGGEYEDHQYTCRWSHTNTSRTGPTIWWQEKNYACGGEGVLTFAKHIKGYRTDLETVVRVAAFLGIDFSKTDVLQLSTRSGFNFIENVEPYPTNFEEDVASAFLGKPVRKYCFFTEQGALSYNLNQYADDAGNTVFLYETRQLCENTNSAVDCLMAPSTAMLFNWHQISSSPDAMIFVHDDPRRAADSQFPGVNTYAGELPYVDKMPWNILKGRSVTYVYNPDMLSSILIGRKLIGIFSDMGIKLKLIAITVAFSTPQGNATYVPVTMRNLEFEEFYAEALANHEIDLKPQEDDNPLCIRSFGEIDHASGDDKDFIIKDLIGRGETCLMIGEYGAGKTGITKLIAHHCANGKTWGNRFLITRPVKVYYIDTEIPRKKFDDWDRKVINGCMLNEQKFKDNFISTCCREMASPFDLSDPDIRDMITAQCKHKGIGFLAVDNQGGASQPGFERSDKGWRGQFEWFRELNKLGISVLLVHHTNKDGEQRGTLKISDDVDLVIKLKKASPDMKRYFAAGTTVAEFVIDKGRYIHGVNQLASCLIGYWEEQGAIHTQILSLDGKPFESDDTAVTVEEHTSCGLDALEEEILKRARSVYPESVCNGDFKNGETGRSSTTVNEKLNRLFDLGLLEREGENKGRKYTAVMKKNSSEQHE